VSQEQPLSSRRILSSLEELSIFAVELATSLPRGVIIGLTGTLGAGKTALVQALCRALGYTAEVLSPTYTLEHIYELPSGEVVYHWDLYRAADEMALLERIGDRKALILVEWPEKLQLELGYQISIRHLENGSREIMFG